MRKKLSLSIYMFDRLQLKQDGVIDLAKIPSIDSLVVQNLKSSPKTHARSLSSKWDEGLSLKSVVVSKSHFRAFKNDFLWN